MIKSVQEHLEAYQRDGYTIFKNYLAPEKVANLRAVCDPEFARRHAEHPERPRATISSILEHETLAPLLAAHILNPKLLDFAEAVMGPYVQLDSMEISGYPSVGVEEKGKVAGWHRDAFNLTEQWVNYPFTYAREPRPYTPPMACNCLTYLQDMTLDSGPLRAIPGSHLDYTYIGKEAHHDPHPNERLVSLEAGDMVYTHCELLHSGTLNTSGAIRYFISIYFSRIGLPHRDTFETPTIKQIVADARQRNDRRVLRLFGIDEGFPPAATSGVAEDGGR
ncbi:phytanoyl-CoA dioxygenase family protein [Chloroflexi bacterium TSY]|nr:phytanoyl-CoA dioxygenase family protein [Chloroflexi bacterium TSY]